jgi:hypothetical protein
MTLARLAIEQGDPALAESTLISLLERDPEHPDAGTLLADVRQQLLLPPSPEQVISKTAALRVWLDTIRLGAERLTR